MTLADRDWRLIPEEPRPGAETMALDAVAAETAAAGGPCTARVYTWRPSTLSLGYAQAANTVDWDFCAARGIDVVRRPTGGGGIYHDEVGDISYSIAVPADAVPGDLMESYGQLLAPVFDAFERMGVDAGIAETSAPALHEPACYLRALNPAHDVVVAGRKISGNAQHRRRDAVVQHGSITYARETETHLGVFAEPGVGPAAFEERVTSVRAEAGIDREEAVAALEAALAAWTGADAGAWTAAELDRAEALVDERFGTEAWTRRR